MNYRIVTDSSSNVLAMPGENYTSVPLKIVAEKMQMSYANAKVIHRRALQKLRGFLGENE